LLLLAQFTSWGGYYAFYVGQAWLALELTDSPAFVSLIATTIVVPFALFSIVGGALADRVNRRRLMIGCRIGVVTMYSVEGALAVAGLIEPWHMLALQFLTGVCIAFEYPAQIRLAADIVRPEQIPATSALMSVVYHVGLILGPLFGGYLLETVGAEGGMFAAAAGNAVMVGCYVLIRIPTGAMASTGSALKGALGGVAYVLRSPAVGFCALIWSAVILTVFPYQALMSVFVRDELAAGGFELGMLLTAPGVGALLGSIAATFDRLVPPTITSMAFALAVAGAALAVLGWATGMTQALVLLALLGSGFGVIYALSYSIPLIETPDELRGRVLGVFQFLWALSPVGSIVAGSIAGEASTRVVFALGGQAAAGLGLGIAAVFVIMGVARAGRRRPVAPATLVPAQPVGSPTRSSPGGARASRARR
jgi:MFS family permease